MPPDAGVIDVTVVSDASAARPGARGGGWRCDVCAARDGTDDAGSANADATAKKPKKRKRKVEVRADPDPGNVPRKDPEAPALRRAVWW